MDGDCTAALDREAHEQALFTIIFLMSNLFCYSLSILLQSSSELRPIFISPIYIHLYIIFIIFSPAIPLKSCFLDLSLFLLSSPLDLQLVHICH